MKISLKNLGILKQAEFSLGDLTIICGENNTGKTYATYALYGFLISWRDLVDFTVDDTKIQTLLTHGGVKINLAQYVDTADRTISDACSKYTSHLDTVFAAPEGRFRNSEFQCQIGTLNIHDKLIEKEIGPPGDGLFSYFKPPDTDKLNIFLEIRTEQDGRIDPDFARAAIQFILTQVTFSYAIPTPFICSAERTGVAIFRKELNFARNRLLKEIGRADQKFNARELLFKAYQSYPQPIGDNLDFIRQLEDIAKKKSFIAKEHPEVLHNFADIIGGEYAVTETDQLHYTPKNTQLKLKMDESSSAARSLLDIGFYLRHVARKGDLLMVDEPELNLHPANQRRIARLFARLVNLGVKVFITTHSDYIIKELNTLIMLNHDKPHLKRIAKENGYRQSELIRSDQVKVYMAREELMPLEEGQKRRRRGHTLVESDIDPVLGIEARSFDDTIDEMNKIEEDIIWGAE